MSLKLSACPAGRFGPEGGSDSYIEGISKKVISARNFAMIRHRMSGKFYKLSMRDVSLRGKTVLVRADYNVPLNKKGDITDDYRIRMSLPTIQKLLEEKCRIVIISHLGRPEGTRDAAYSLEPVAKRLATLLGHNVRFVNECVGPKVFMAIKRAPQGTVTLLENLRFHPEEEANDSAFARQLAKQTHAQYFVQDGFGVVHRAHASTSAITQYLPSMAGLLLEREYMTITEAMKHPARPLVAVLGGAKVSDKIGVIQALVKVADTIVLGGAMANTFLAHDRMRMGKSKIEPAQDEVIERIYESIRQKVGNKAAKTFLQLPVDLGVSTSLEVTATRKDISARAVGNSEYALDIGPASVEAMIEVVSSAQTVIWNGTLGMAELPAFAKGSVALAQCLTSHPDITSVIGGGDTTDFVLNWDKKASQHFTHISTGGGASLELMSGKVLPGIKCLLPAKK